MALFSGQLLVNLLGILTAFMVIGYAYFKWSYQYWKRRNVPYFEPSIPFGTLPSPYKRTVNIGEEFKKVYKKAKANGWKHVGLYSLSAPTYLPVDLDLLKNIMAKDFQYFTDRGSYTNDRDDPINSHLAHIGGQRWRNLRAKLNPVFTSGKLKAMFQTLVDCELKLEKYFEESVENRTAVDAKDIFRRVTINVIVSCAFGIDCNTLKEPNSPFKVIGEKLFEGSIWKMLKRMFCEAYPNLARALRVTNLPKDINEFFTKLVEENVKYREENNIVRRDILQLLIDLKNNKEGHESGYKGGDKTLTMTEVITQSFVFFAGGFETGSTAMMFAFFELATRPKIQEKAREEIQTVLARYDNQITYESVSDLKYLGQIVDETLRLYPPSPTTARVCEEDYKVPGEDVIIEKGVRVIIPILPIHHDEEYYKNPEVFDPERFSDENKKGRHPYAHIPFGEGPRICLGQRFGVMQIKVALICILRNFKVTLNEKTSLPVKLSPKSMLAAVEGGIWLNFEKL